MPYRPYPNRDRALRELARKEAVPTRKFFRTDDGQFGEEHVFPGQSFAVATARMSEKLKQARIPLVTGTVGQFA